MGDARIAVAVAVEQERASGRRSDGDRRSTAASRRSAAFAVWYLRAVTFINFLSAAWVSLGQDVRRHNTENYFTPYLLTAGFASGVFTMFLAITMRRRKRAAWILNSVLSGLFLLLFGIAMAFPEIRQYAQNWVSLALTAAFVGSLAVGRREFYAKGDRSNPKLAAAVALGGLLVTSLLAALLVTVTNDAHDAHRSTFLDRWRYGTLRLVSVAADDSHYPRISTPNWADVTVNVLSTLLVLAVLYAAFRSWRAVDPLTEDDEKRLRELLDRNGDRDSLGYFALRREKSVVWSPTGKAAVAYRVVGGVSLASGDPIGDPEAWPGAIEPWLAEAREHGWIPAVMGASEEAGDRLLPAWTRRLGAGRRSPRRDGRVHPRRTGHADRPAGLQPGEAGRVPGAHPAARGHPGRRDGVSAPARGRLARRRDRARFQHGAGLARRPRGRALRDARMHGRRGLLAGGAVLRALGPRRALPRPDAARPRRGERADGVHGDRTPAARPGDRDHPGLAQLRHVPFGLRAGARLGAGPVLRLWRSLLSFFSRWWQIESLYRANAKYRPIWEPRFLLFEKSADLLRIGVASARAEGFLEAPGLPKWLHRKHLESHR